jgi:hypothetical protein
MERVYANDTIKTKRHATLMQAQKQAKGLYSTELN